MSQDGASVYGPKFSGPKNKNTPLIKKIDLSSAQGISARRRSPPIGGERLRGDFPRAEIPVPPGSVHTLPKRPVLDFYFPRKGMKIQIWMQPSTTKY